MAIIDALVGLLYTISVYGFWYSVFIIKEVPHQKRVGYQKYAVTTMYVCLVVTSVLITILLQL